VIPLPRRLFGFPVTRHFRSVWSPNWSPTGAISADRGCRRDGGQGARTLLGPSSRRGVQKAPAKSWPEDSRPGQMTRSAPVHETGPRSSSSYATRSRLTAFGPKRLPIRSKSNRSWSRPSGTGACSLALRVRAEVSAREQTGTCLACESGSAADRPPPLWSSRGCRFVHRKRASADGAPRRSVVVRGASDARTMQTRAWLREAAVSGARAGRGRLRASRFARLQ
jgi:hypothetical protein